MAVLAEDHVGDEHQARVEHDQRLTRQGPGADRAQLLDAVLRGSEMISVKNLDAIARQQWGESTPIVVTTVSNRSAVVPTFAAEIPVSRLSSLL